MVERYFQPDKVENFETIDFEPVWSNEEINKLTELLKKDQNFNQSLKSI